MSSDAERQIITKLLERCEQPVIVDLGAYHGEDAEWMFKAVQEKHPRGLVVEADPENFRAIIANTNYPQDVNVLNAAIASHTGACDFWACYTEIGRGSGSIREPSGHRKKDGIVYDFRKLEPILCYSLDDLVDQYELDHIDILWVDIQGAERDMIAGGAKALQRSRYMLIEAEETELYSGQALRQELIKLLPDWIVVGEFEQNLFLQNSNVREEIPRYQPPPPSIPNGNVCMNCGSSALGFAGGMRRCNQCGTFLP